VSSIETLPVPGKERNEGQWKTPYRVKRHHKKLKKDTVGSDVGADSEATRPKNILTGNMTVVATSFATGVTTTDAPANKTPAPNKVFYYIPFGSQTVKAQFNQSYTFPRCQPTLPLPSNSWMAMWKKKVDGEYVSVTLSTADRVHAINVYNDYVRMDLVFTKVLKEDEGLYKCQLRSRAIGASTDGGPSRTIKLIVEGYPFENETTSMIPTASTESYSSSRTNRTQSIPTASTESYSSSRTNHTQSTASDSLISNDTTDTTWLNTSPSNAVGAGGKPVSTDGSSNSVIISVTVVVVTVFVVLAVVLGYSVYRHRRGWWMPSAWPYGKSSVSRQSSTQSTQPCIRDEREVADERLGDVNAVQKQPVAVRPRSVIKYDPLWEWPREQLKFTDEILGRGYFGVVLEAETSHPFFKGKTSKKVAVKMVKGDEDVPFLTEALAVEANIMKNIGRHENVLSLLGLCTTNGRLWLITEFAEHGDFRSYLRSKRPPENTLPESTIPSVGLHEFKLPEKDMFRYAFQIAKGMEFLMSHRCIHRDLACRNVLVCDGEVLKVADFGLAKELKYCEYYRRKNKEALPVKWTAPEALFDEKLYTEFSDVWSYGILLWEMATLGGKPYPGVSEERLFRLLSTSNYRLSRPRHCPEKMYSIMKKCWEAKSTDRPRFKQLREKLEIIVAEFEAPDAQT
jgi:hypothetical protein